MRNPLLVVGGAAMVGGGGGRGYLMYVCMFRHHGCLCNPDVFFVKSQVR